MIASLSGQIQAIHDDSMIVEVQGVGYRVFVPESMLNDTSRIGHHIEVYTHTYVRENEIALYGFGSWEELDLFSMLLGVSGIGPRTALAALSSFSPESLRSVIAQGDAAALKRIPGVGLKTAQRMMLDLKDKIGVATVTWDAPSMGESDADVINALTALGYSVSEAQSALAMVPDDVQELDERILSALRSLGGS